MKRKQKRWLLTIILPVLMLLATIPTQAQTSTKADVKVVKADSRQRTESVKEETDKIHRQLEDARIQMDEGIRAGRLTTPEIITLKERISGLEAQLAAIEQMKPDSEQSSAKQNGTSTPFTVTGTEVKSEPDKNTSDEFSKKEDVSKSTIPAQVNPELVELRARQAEYVARINSGQLSPEEAAVIKEQIRITDQEINSIEQR